jgi:hypothetical protein
MTDQTGRRRVQSSALNCKLSPQHKKGKSQRFRRRFLVSTIIPISFLLGLLFFQGGFSLDNEVFAGGFSLYNEVFVGGCQGYKGILHISQGDVEGAAGTIFFLFVLNQLLYAEKHSLIPWVHLNDISRYVYDPIVHGKGNPITFELPTIVNASWTAFIDPISNQEVAFAGPPLQGDSPTLRTSNVTVTGNGVWSSYFYPVSRFSPSDPSCTKLPLVRLTHQQIIPGRK